jgi:nicotinamide mononucleotide transporter
MEDLAAAAISFGWLQWLAVVFNIAYVILAARENILCWWFGLVGVTLLAFIYFDAKLYSDTLLQMFYIVMSVYGWFTWSSRSSHQLAITRSNATNHFYYLLAGIIGTIVLGSLFNQFGAALPYVDAFTSAFAVVATYLVAQKVLENWLYWIVIDSTCVVVYILRDLDLIALLFAIYTILAIAGYLVWIKKFRLQNL